MRGCRGQRLDEHKENVMAILRRRIILLTGGAVLLAGVAWVAFMYRAEDSRSNNAKAREEVARREDGVRGQVVYNTTLPAEAQRLAVKHVAGLSDPGLEKVIEGIREDLYKELGTDKAAEAPEKYVTTRESVTARVNALVSDSAKGGVRRPGLERQMNRKRL